MKRRNFFQALGLGALAAPAFLSRKADAAESIDAEGGKVVAEHKGASITIREDGVVILKSGDGPDGCVTIGSPKKIHSRNQGEGTITSVKGTTNTGGDVIATDSRTTKRPLEYDIQTVSQKRLRELGITSRPWPR